MNYRNAMGVAFVAIAGFVATNASAYGLLPTKWDVGGNAGEAMAPNLGTPGAASWSIMDAGLAMEGSHSNTSNFGDLIGTSSTVEEEVMIDACMNLWASVSGFVNLGKVTDGNSAANASNANGGHLGDMRFGATDGFSVGVLAHAYQPGSESSFGSGWNIAGDTHISTDWNWADDPTDTNSDNDFDLFTVLLHEIGHALGLDHSLQFGSVMEPIYAGARRTLHQDDIDGIQAIYGPNTVVPEPASMAVLGLGSLAMLRKRRRQS